MTLSDTDILKKLETGELGIEPLGDIDQQVQPSSVDVRLDNKFLKFNPQNLSAIDPLEDEPSQFMDEIVIDDGDKFIVHPGDFILGSTIEWVDIPETMVGFVNGRSTMGRLAIVIHATAGLLDPGWEGNVTLEISNLGTVPVKLTPGMRIGQLTFTELDSKCSRPYGEERNSKYQGQTGVQSASTDVGDVTTEGISD